jgi:CRISPR-associated protein Csa1
MYYLSEDERKHLLKGLLPKTRRTEVAEELRGWNWPEPPIEPPYPVRLALYEVAGGYCPTGRDVYLRHVHGVKSEPSPAMIRGALFHAVLASVTLEAKRLIYRHGVEEHRRILEDLSKLAEDPGFGPHVKQHLDRLEPGGREEAVRQARILRDFEVHRIIARMQDIMVRQPHIGTDSLACQTIPVVVEQKLDGRFLGLSSQLSVDAYTSFEMMILDTKFARHRDFHRLTTTGYAMAYEALTEYPVNIGCIVYARLDGDRLTVEKDFHIIDDELRQWFIEERDEKARMVYEELDPGLPSDCPAWCSYHAACHPR